MGFESRHRGGFCGQFFDAQAKTQTAFAHMLRVDAAVALQACGKLRPALCGLRCQSGILGRIDALALHPDQSKIAA